MPNKKTTILDVLNKQKTDSVRRSAQHGSAKWLENQMKKLGKDSKKSLPTVGKMFLYVYDPKGKAELPVFDSHPLVMPFRLVNNGFLGINYHYLNPRIRAVMLDKLIEISGNKHMTDNSKLKLSWSLMQTAATQKWAEAAVHRYLYSHIKTPLTLIPQSDWSAVAQLPLARFHGMSNASVYRRLK